jgi:hypothetical protein
MFTATSGFRVRPFAIGHACADVMVVATRSSHRRAPAPSSSRTNR